MCTGTRYQHRDTLNVAYFVHTMNGRTNLLAVIPRSSCNNLRVIRLRQYLLGHHFTIYTNHKWLFTRCCSERAQSKEILTLWAAYLYRHHLLTTTSNPVTSSHSSKACQNHYVQQMTYVNLPSMIQSCPRLF